MQYHEVEVSEGKFFLLPRCTSVLDELQKHELIPGRVWKSESAAYIGRQSHDLIRRINRGGVIERPEWWSLPEKTKNAVRAYLAWKKATGYRSRHSEVSLYSLVWGVSGTADDIGTIKRFVTICDWKLGDIHSERVKYQLVIYGFLYLEMWPSRTLNGGFRGVHLDRDNATFDEVIIPLDEGREYFKKFLAMKHLVGIL